MYETRSQDADHKLAAVRDDRAESGHPGAGRALPRGTQARLQGMGRFWPRARGTQEQRPDNGPLSTGGAGGPPDSRRGELSPQTDRPHPVGVSADRFLPGGWRRGNGHPGAGGGERRHHTFALRRPSMACTPALPEQGSRSIKQHGNRQSLHLQIGRQLVIQ